MVSKAKAAKYAVCFYLIPCCVACCLYFLINKPSKDSIKHKIEAIPINDRLVINTFFRIFLLKSAGAYTLFSDKPMTFDSFFDPYPGDWTSLCRRPYLENMQLKKGWEVWQKYQHLFPSSRFIIQSRRLNSNQVEIVLIHKRHLTQMMNRHLDNFQKVLGEKITPLELLSRYQSGKEALFNLLNEHHGLLGILLGFGKRNAWLYQKRERISQDLYPFTLNTHPDPSPGFKTLAEERAYYQNTLTSAFTHENTRKCFKFLYVPGFVVDPQSEETQELQKKYLEQRKAIHAIYSHGNFLETTLRQLTSKAANEV